jgi:hypothetical protein
VNASKRGISASIGGLHRGHGDRPLDPGAPCTRHSYGGLIGPATDFNRVGSVEIYFYSS